MRKPLQTRYANACFVLSLSSYYIINNSWFYLNKNSRCWLTRLLFIHSELPQIINCFAKHQEANSLLTAIHEDKLNAFKPAVLLRLINN